MKQLCFLNLINLHYPSDQVIELEKFIRTSIQNTNMKILIEGHTDTMGTDSYNSKLSIKEQILLKNI